MLLGRTGRWRTRQPGAKGGTSCESGYFVNYPHFRTRKPAGRIEPVCRHWPNSVPRRCGGAGHQFGRTCGGSGTGHVRPVGRLGHLCSGGTASVRWPQGLVRRFRWAELRNAGCRGGLSRVWDRRGSRRLLAHTVNPILSDRQYPYWVSWPLLPAHRLRVRVPRVRRSIGSAGLGAKIRPEMV
jgi:hypothetical protein